MASMMGQLNLKAYLLANAGEQRIWEKNDPLPRKDAMFYNKMTA